jgi:hypothetical protein
MEEYLARRDVIVIVTGSQLSREEQRRNKKVKILPLKGNGHGIMKARGSVSLWPPPEEAISCPTPGALFMADK